MDCHCKRQSQRDLLAGRYYTIRHAGILDVRHLMKFGDTPICGTHCYVIGARLHYSSLSAINQLVRYVACHNDRRVYFDVQFLWCRHSPEDFLIAYDNEAIAYPKSV